MQASRSLITLSGFVVVAIAAQEFDLSTNRPAAEHPIDNSFQDAQRPFGVDSAGVRLITISRSEVASLPLWRIEPTRINIGTGRAQPEYLLNRPGLPWRLTNGNIVFPNNSTELRFYNSDGVYIKTVGRKGLGPGEFDAIHSVRPGAGDSILVLESDRLRVNVFTASGAFVRMYRVTETGVQPFGPRWLGSNKLVVGMAPAGTQLGSAQASVATDSLFVVVRTVTGSSADTVGRIARVLSRRSPVGRMSIPFYGGPQLATGIRSFATSESDAFRIRWYDTTGRLLRIVRSLEMTNQVPLDSIAAFETMVSGRADQGKVPLQQYSRRGPLITSLVLDRLERLWIKQWAPASATVAQWIVFDNVGRPLGRLSAPVSLNFVDADAERLVARVRGDLDVESIVVYAIRR